MTKAIWVLIILAAAYVGYLVFQQWDKARIEHDNARRQAAAAIMTPEALPGMPYQLDQSLRAAKEKGPAAFRAWFNTYERQLVDPRRAWIELELCVASARENFNQPTCQRHSSLSGVNRTFVRPRKRLG